MNIAKLAEVFIGGLMGLALFAVAVSKNSNTTGVLNGTGTLISSSIGAAEKG